MVVEKGLDRKADGAELEHSGPDHIPVLLDEAIEWLRPTPSHTYVDATVGLGGHSREILRRSAPDGLLLAIDADPQALCIARQRLAPWKERVTFVQGRHRDLSAMAHRAGMRRVHGVILDLGVSSLQLQESERGFSFAHDGPLDMRMGPDADLTAADIVNTWSQEEIARIIYEYGEERHSRRIARAICADRPFRRTGELAALVARVVGHRGRIHPATLTFQALRIAVNGELDSLRAVLPQVVKLLEPGGRMVVISFHSLEDRIVKRFIAREARDCICPPRVPQCVCGHVATLRRLTKKPISATPDEVARNPASRSARMRVAERLPAVSSAADAGVGF